MKSLGKQSKIDIGRDKQMIDAVMEWLIGITRWTLDTVHWKVVLLYIPLLLSSSLIHTLQQILFGVKKSSDTLPYFIKHAETSEKTLWKLIALLREDCATSFEGS